MRFIADLHIHSRYSRATSRHADLRNYFLWARIKGIQLVGTGDFTHPEWFSEISSQLREEDGLLRFREEPDNPESSAGGPAGQPVRFLLSAEISSIYKKRGATRKVHSLLLVPSLEAAGRVGRKLAAIGNVASDGRPILGLDAKDLLAMLLDVSPTGLFIPAHVWTPWFSVFGSKSGFDAIEDCFEDLTPFVPALETGLSSDPPMNWRWSALDRFRLVSNSDAHSPPNLGREANLFETEMSFEGVRRALTTGQGFRGTLEFYPEEGKYHVDGHRKCRAPMDPEETVRRGGACPVCGKQVTVGVLHRVLALADRSESRAPRPAEGYRYVIPLPEILAELRGTGPGTTAVASLYEKLVSAFGSEFALLLDAPIADVELRFGALLAEAIRRMREGRVNPTPGYDGEFGTIHLFEDGEVDRLRGQEELFGTTARALSGKRKVHSRRLLPGEEAKEGPEPQGPLLDPEQTSAASASSGAALVFAGPGAGKTRVLAHWISRLLLSGDALPGEILAVTFTNRAAGELRDRLSSLAGHAGNGVLVATFHSFCLSLLREQDPALRSVYGPRDREDLLRMVLPDASPAATTRLAHQIEGYYEGTLSADGELAHAISTYENTLASWGAVDLSALITRTTRLLKNDPLASSRIQARFRFLAVDELQDINAGQFELLRLLAKPGTSTSAGPRPRGILCIGDPDQAIYGFRGSDRALFFRFRDEFSAAVFTLSRNYRSSGNIARAASSLFTETAAFSGSLSSGALSSVRPAGERIRLFAAVDPEEEGAFIAQTIRDLVGGVDSVSVDAVRDPTSTYSFSDFAVLFRTRAVRDALLPSLLRAGLPVTFRENTPLSATEPFSHVLSALRFLENPRDSASLARLLGHLAPRKSAAELWAAATSLTTRPREAPLDLTRISGLTEESRERLDRLREITDNLAKLLGEGGVALVMDRVLALVRLDRQDPEVAIGEELFRETAQEAGTDLSACVSLLSTLNFESEGSLRSEKIRLLTFHASKGLEFPVAFLCGAEEGVTPLPDDLDEERRLFYVAVTRAADLLYITHCATRRFFGEARAMQPSRFLSQIPAACGERLRARPKKRTGDSQLTLFP